VAYLLIGGGPLVAGIVFGAIFASNARRVFVLAVVGLVLLVALLAGIVLTAPADEPEDCWECGEVFGRWLQPVIFFWALFNFLAWTMGILVGGVARAALKRSAAPAG
jgi:hypothetical protein